MSRDRPLADIPEVVINEKELSNLASVELIRRSPRYTVEITALPPLAVEGDSLQDQRAVTPDEPTPGSYKLYRRRWLGLLQLVMFNLMFGWNWFTFTSVSATAERYFGVSPMSINALSLCFIGMLCIFSPVVTWVIYYYGTKPAFIVSGLTLLFGSWIQHIGTEAQVFGVIVSANVLFGSGNAFALILPTHYSDLWFSPRARIGATAVATLANPAGWALGQFVTRILVDPANPGTSLTSMILITSIISTVACTGTFLIPETPPTPASASRSVEKVAPGIAFLILIRNKNFWLLSIPFATYFGLFASMTFLLYQVFCPWVGARDLFGICGVACISGGLAAASITTPLIGGFKSSLTAIKVLISIAGLCHLALIWVPDSNAPTATLVIGAILGAATFCLIPTTLEYLVDIMHPIAPESASSLCWAAGQFFGIVFISVMVFVTSLTTQGGSNPYPNNTKIGLIFQAACALTVMPLPFLVASSRLPPPVGNGSDPRRVAEVPIYGNGRGREEM